VRVIVATHRNLEDLVHARQFRQDLYHGIYVFPIPPASVARAESMTSRLLVEHFTRQIAEQNDWKPQTFTPEALDALKRYSWPGNVRELRNIVERPAVDFRASQVEANTVNATLPHQTAGLPSAAGPS